MGCCCWLKGDDTVSLNNSQGLISWPRVEPFPKLLIIINRWETQTNWRHTAYLSCICFKRSMIDVLATIFPVFPYKTCIQVSNAFPFSNLWCTDHSSGSTNRLVLWSDTYPAQYTTFGTYSILCPESGCQLGFRKSWYQHVHHRRVCLKALSLIRQKLAWAWLNHFADSCMHRP